MSSYEPAALVLGGCGNSVGDASGACVDKSDRDTVGIWVGIVLSVGEGNWFGVSVGAAFGSVDEVVFG